MSDPSNLTSQVENTIMVQRELPCPPGPVAQREPTFAAAPMEHPPMAPEEEEQYPLEPALLEEPPMAQREEQYPLEPALLEEPPMAPEEEEEEEEEEDLAMEGRCVCFYDEMLELLDHGIKPIKNLQQIGFLERKDFPDSEQEFLEKCGKMWKAQGVPRCCGFWWGRAHNCSLFMPAPCNQAQCDNCRIEHVYITNP